MWSEHCSYKSSRIHLKRLPTEAPWVLVGPGENAGVVDLGDGIAGAFRIESHNHPSAIEPYQGAATGAGGILRDIFTMGARPIALMDPLRFGPIDDARSRWIAEGVVSGISGYGNSVGVPTVGGETIFDETYKGNPLVNVFCLGTMPTERLVLGEATGLGNVAILFGSSTGRDGIGGVSVLASAGFDDSEDDSAKRPSVQVGDPYEEKRLIEACLELLNEGLVVGIQDLGGAGFVCATSETASRGGMGMDVDVTAVHRRQEGMEPFEVMTSESQERMLAIVEPDGVDRVLELCAKWEVQASVVGKVVEGGALRILDGWEGEELANIPASSLHDDAPLYDRPMEEPDRSGEVDPVTLDAPADLWSDLTDMLMDTSWVHNQYDSQLFLNTVVGPGSDATLLRLKHPETNVDTGRGIGMTTDGNHHWCIVNPFRGTAMTVAESILNLACVGAKPLALVNNLNFGNPEHPVTMWQLSQSVDGMTEASNAFTVPVVGGNVSLYNEANGHNIDPTPVVGMLGMTDTIEHAPPGHGAHRRTSHHRPRPRRRWPRRIAVGPRPRCPRRRPSRTRLRHAPSRRRGDPQARVRRCSFRGPRHRWRRPRRRPDRNGDRRWRRRNRGTRRRPRRIVQRSAVPSDRGGCSRQHADRRRTRCSPRGTPYPPRSGHWRLDLFQGARRRFPRRRDHPMARPSPNSHGRPVSVTASRQSACPVSRHASRRSGQMPSASRLRIASLAPPTMAGDAQTSPADSDGPLRPPGCASLRSLHQRRPTTPVQLDTTSPLLGVS